MDGYGGAAELVASPAMSRFAQPDQGVPQDEDAALPMNYLTAQFALAERGQLRAGETVLVHNAAGGVGTASIQVAKGCGGRTIAVVSTPEKADVARAAGADEAVLMGRRSPSTRSHRRCSTWTRKTLGKSVVRVR